VRTGRGRPHCPLCRVVFVGTAESYDCPACATRYHQDCADELGGCSTLGCPRLGAGPDDADPDDQRWRARVHRYRDGAVARRASGRRLRQEHVAEAQAAGETGLTGWQVAGGCLDCLSLLAIIGVVLLAAGLALAT
jgi:hypothetical protein